MLLKINIIIYNRKPKSERQFLSVKPRMMIMRTTLTRYQSVLFKRKIVQKSGFSNMINIKATVFCVNTKFCSHTTPLTLLFKLSSSVTKHDLRKTCTLYQTSNLALNILPLSLDIPFFCCLFFFFFWKGGMGHQTFISLSSNTSTREEEMLLYNSMH